MQKVVSGLVVVVVAWSLIGTVHADGESFAKLSPSSEESPTDLVGPGESPGTIRPYVESVPTISLDCPGTRHVSTNPRKPKRDRWTFELDEPRGMIRINDSPSWKNAEFSQETIVHEAVRIQEECQETTQVRFDRLSGEVTVIHKRSCGEEVVSFRFEGECRRARPRH